MAQQVAATRRNRILNVLSSSDMALLAPHLEPVPLKFRQRLQTGNRLIKAAYFPGSGLASVVAVGSGERRQAEVAMIGYEGMTGIPIVLGTDRSPYDVFMQVEGRGHCIDAEMLRKLLQKSPSMLKCFLRFAHAFDVQSGYTSLANAQGKLEQRLARWLLMADDRIEGPELLLTHEFLALMLGVRRAGVTLALQHLESKGLLETRRGAVIVVDRDGLKESADGLYGAPEAEYERLLSGPCS
jgi:CRP-like cAMP-binding protein